MDDSFFRPAFEILKKAPGKLWKTALLARRNLSRAETPFPEG